MSQGCIVLALALAFGAAGCNVVPTKAYEGPSRPQSELSLLKGGASGEEYGYRSLVQPLAVDGVRVREGAFLVSFLPGRRSIEVRETVRLFKGVRTQYCAFELESVAGCLYIPRPPSPPADALSGRDESWEWSVDVPVSAECSDGVGFQLRAQGRCGASTQALRKASP